MRGKYNRAAFCYISFIRGNTRGNKPYQAVKLTRFTIKYGLLWILNVFVWKQITLLKINWDVTAHSTCYSLFYHGNTRMEGHSGQRCNLIATSIPLDRTFV